MTSPTTSSITAALTRIDPTRVWERFTELDAELITANVVPVYHQSYSFDTPWGFGEFQHTQ